MGGGGGDGIAIRLGGRGGFGGGGGRGFGGEGGGGGLGSGGGEGGGDPSVPHEKLIRSGRLPRRAHPNDSPRQITKRACESALSACHMHAIST